MDKKTYQRLNKEFMELHLTREAMTDDEFKRDGKALQARIDRLAKKLDAYDAQK